MKRVICTTIFFVFFLVFLNSPAHAYKFLNGDLEIYGEIEQELDYRTKKDDRNVEISSNRFKFRPELRYKILENNTTLVNFYFNGNYFWDFGLKTDGDLKRAVELYSGDKYKKDYRRPTNEDQVIKDMYVNVKHKDWQVRVGKQLVSWGETASARVADVINPMDYAYYTNNPVWDEYKMGLWMARLFYTPADMWQDISFEGLVIPFEFIPEKQQVAGVSPFNFLNNNHLQLIQDQRYRDAPDYSLKNCEFGGRVRGFWRNLGTGVDWTVSHFYSRQDVGVIDNKSAYNQYTWLFLLGTDPKGKVFDYPFYNVTSATFSTTLPGPDLTIGGEASYKWDQKFQYGPTSTTSFKVRETGKLDTALKISRSFYIPGFSDNVWLGNSSEPLYAELTSYYSKMPNMKHDRNTGDQIWWTGGTNGAQSSQTSFTLVLMTNLFNGKLTPFCLHTYDTNGQTTQNYTLSYQPTYHWTFQVYYMKFNKSGILKYQNQVGMLWRYNFF